MASDPQTILRAALLTLAAMWAFWALYVFTMGLYRAFLKRRLRGLSLIMCSPVVALAFALDVVMQLTVFTIVFLELPRDPLVTYRLRRYMRELPPEHWRRRWTDYLCKHLLDPFDPTGSHCDSDTPQLNA